MVEPRILAVVSTPPEARPGQEVIYRFLAVGPRGEVETSSVVAAYCTSPKPLTENNSISKACLEEPGSPLDRVGDTAVGLLPTDACALFGPDPPPGDFRPRDPDASGGFFVPLRIEAFDQTFVFLERVFCNPAGVDADVAREFSARYVMNENPVVPELSIEEAAGQAVVTTARLPAASAEEYVKVDPRSRLLVDVREDLTVTWFVTAGSVESTPSMKLDGNEYRASATWIVPRDADCHIWAVVHDSRGGSSFAALSF